MTDDDLTARLQQVLLAAQRRFRQQRGFGALVTPFVPDRLIDEVAHGLAPLLRELVREAWTEPRPLGSYDPEQALRNVAPLLGSRTDEPA